MNEIYDSEDFERLLKEQADSFFMMPSERVWKSIYNDLHPGSKWPSLAIGLFMVIMLFWIGNMNRIEITGETPHTEDVPSAELNTSGSTSIAPDVLSSAPVATDRPAGLTNSEQIASTARQIAEVYHMPVISSPMTAQPEVGEKIAEEKMSLADEAVTPKTTVSDAVTMTKKETTAKAVEESGITKSALTVQEEESTQFDLRTFKRKKVKWEYFFNPMVTNVKFGGTNLNLTETSVVYSPVSKHNMDIAKKLGFIAGANAYYPISKRVSLTSGIQLIYTGYDIYSEVVRPNITSLTFKDSKGKLFSKNYVSYYANEKNGGSTNITNYNWQFSVPVGVKVEVFSNEKLSVSAVSSVEPFMVVGSNAYLLSGDASGYVNDPNLVRKFNMNARAGGFVSFSGQVVDWNIGPDFRYQILSTYNNIYPVKEHFISYGIHVGVSKK